MLYTFGGKDPQVDPTAFVSASAELIGDVIVGPRCYIGPLCRYTRRCLAHRA